MPIDPPPILRLVEIQPNGQQVTEYAIGVDAIPVELTSGLVWGEQVIHFIVHAELWSKDERFQQTHVLRPLDRSLDDLEDQHDIDGDCAEAEPNSYANAGGLVYGGKSYDTSESPSGSVHHDSTYGCYPSIIVTPAATEPPSTIHPQPPHHYHHHQHHHRHHQEQHLLYGSGAMPPHLPSSTSKISPIPTLFGSLVAHSQFLTSPNGGRSIFFIFNSISVRIQGEFKLKFNLVDLGRALTGGSAAVISTIFSDTFISYPWKKYPGISDSRLKAQGSRRPDYFSHSIQ
ncbi:velvet factor [Polychytrium aggregatum]|uniref:velvet factor n=1 Tax=Polychytrium aggregatum TaxID=110093 RepID=UPI0022FE5357|nr:velvet factor [Polychytrium aggregatum]KAI9193034.1 velvet factor [Polychytrium aggregatum]